MTRQRCMRIYIAGPISNPDPEQVALNVLAAIHAGIAVYQMGHIPYVPALTHYVEEVSNEIGAGLGYEDWMRGDFSWLRCCDAVVCLGRSPGTDREIVEAERLGIPVYSDVAEIQPVEVRA